jgi:hypothetical protein
MRRIVLGMVVLGAVIVAQGAAAGVDGAPAQDAAPAAAPKRAFPWDKRVRQAKRYARRRGGSVSFAVISETGKLRGFKRGRQYSSASVVKAMIMVSYLRKRGVRRRKLRGSEKALISPMITRSENGAASAMYERVGPGGLEKLARAARMRRFEADEVWGGSQITARDQAKFFYRIRQLTPRRHRSYALGILRRIVPGQRWGIPPGKPKRWSIHFKGGWYPGGYGWRVHQAALLRRNGRRLSLAVLTEGGPSLSYGAETITGVTRRLLRGYNGFRRPGGRPRK